MNFLKKNITENSAQNTKHKQKLKKYAVFALMAIAFCIFMYLVFAPSEKEKEDKSKGKGFNMVIPMPKERKDGGIIADKKYAYEQDNVKVKKQDKLRSLHDFSSWFANDNSSSIKQEHYNENQFEVNESLITPKPKTVSNSSIKNSTKAYREISSTLNNFFEDNEQDLKSQELRKEIEELKSQNKAKSNIDEKMELMERSYQMASKYLPMGIDNNKGDKTDKSKKTKVVPITHVKEQVVSSLKSPSLASLVQSNAFHTPTSIIDAQQSQTRNTISACVHQKQTIMNGQNIRLRLTEPMQAGVVSIPKNAIISGVGTIQAERLNIAVSSIEHLGIIMPVELIAYDTDGQQGIFIPNIMEVNAAKEVVGGMGTTAGTSISLAGDPSQQLAADIGRGVIQGASQFISKKLQEVKITLKAGYNILLLPKEQN